MLAGRTLSRKVPGRRAGRPKAVLPRCPWWETTRAEAVQSGGASQSHIAPVLPDGLPSVKHPGRQGRWPKAAGRSLRGRHRCRGAARGPPLLPTAWGPQGSPGSPGHAGLGARPLGGLGRGAELVLQQRPRPLGRHPPHPQAYRAVGATGAAGGPGAATGGGGGQQQGGEQ